MNTFLAEARRKALQLALIMAVTSLATVCAQTEYRPGWSIEMTRQVYRNWAVRDTFQVRRPVMIDVELDGQGNVIETAVRVSSGDEAFDLSARDAVRAASPMPIPANPQLLQPDGKTIKVKKVTLELRPRRLKHP